MWFVQRLVTSVDCEAAVWCGRYGEQQTLDALLHSGRIEACLVTALADQPTECYHILIKSWQYQCNHQGLQYCHRDSICPATATCCYIPDSRTCCLAQILTAWWQRHMHVTCVLFHKSGIIGNPQALGNQYAMLHLHMRLKKPWVYICST